MLVATCGHPGQKKRGLTVVESCGGGCGWRPAIGPGRGVLGRGQRGPRGSARRATCKERARVGVLRWWG
eukprot:2982847-Rhodomonas_salina.1